MQTVKGVKVRCIKLLKNKVYKFARYTLSPQITIFLYENEAHLYTTLFKKDISTIFY